MSYSDISESHNIFMYMYIHIHLLTRAHLISNDASLSYIASEVHYVIVTNKNAVSTRYGDDNEA